MSQSQLLAEAVSALDSAGVGYVLTGSLVSSLQGYLDEWASRLDVVDLLARVRAQAGE